MTPVEGATIFQKFSEAVKDLPAWIFSAFATTAAVLLFVPLANAELPMEYRPWLVISLVLFGVLAIFKWVVVVLRAWRAFQAEARVRKTFHLTPIAQQCHWSVSKQADGSMVTQIVANFAVKNQSSSPVGLVGVRVIKPKIKGDVLHDDILVRQQHGRMYGTAQVSDYRIAPGTTLPGQAMVMIRGEPGGSRERDLDVTLGIKDEDGNEQRVAVLCWGVKNAKPSDDPIPVEALYSITDPIEKDVAAVLQAEMVRYEKNNRSRGGFGSFYMTYDGRSDLQIPGDSWVMNTARNQEISETAEQNVIRSDSLDALLTIYSRLETSDERERYTNVLLSRLHEDRGYARVAYLIVMALWKVGLLGAALDAAMFGLPEDDQRTFGMSNVLMLLNAMLRFQHFQFTNDELDTIERFIQTSGEHTFRIPQKISAIRACRIIKTAG
ncbi:hypothetical protein B9Z43_12025 [Limnohabitans sp. MMS-10A-192]|uniref:hypothetical protein n=1 Tax=Limnohabitans sp. MMS-10A-192 TaxID=1835769 RepID=UPI000D344EEC|nr:hypothetical protein [Limnohabitans sp. MMS-10A-192]PUE18518.1 hypothetical protein B9Z43_12025 [Limnohabitans sp. MMS-10A-192]